MGTRSHTYIVEGETPIAAMYQQYDGYLEGVGNKIATFLVNRKVVNGHTGDKAEFNGIGDLGARLFASLKGDPETVGNQYLIAPTSADSEEYGYYVSIRDDAVHLVVTADGKRIFSGTPAELLGVCESLVT